MRQEILERKDNRSQKRSFKYNTMHIQNKNRLVNSNKNRTKTSKKESYTKRPEWPLIQPESKAFGSNLIHQQNTDYQELYKQFLLNKTLKKMILNHLITFIKLLKIQNFNGMSKKIKLLHSPVELLKTTKNTSKKNRNIKTINKQSNNNSFNSNNNYCILIQQEDEEHQQQYPVAKTPRGPENAEKIIDSNSSEKLHIQYLERNIKRYQTQIQQKIVYEKQLLLKINELTKQLQGKNDQLQQMAKQLQNVTDKLAIYKRQFNTIKVLQQGFKQSEIQSHRIKKQSNMKTNILKTYEKDIEQFRNQIISQQKTIQSLHHEIQNWKAMKLRLEKEKKLSVQENQQLKMQIQTMILDAKLQEKNRQFKQLTNYELTLKNHNYGKSFFKEDFNNLNVGQDQDLVRMLKQKIQKLERDLTKSQTIIEQLRSIIIKRQKQQSRQDTKSMSVSIDRTKRLQNF